MLKIRKFCFIIVPKSLLNAPEFNKTRAFNKIHRQKICDYGEKAFKGVKIEQLVFYVLQFITNDKVTIESYIRKTCIKRIKAYIL